MFRVEGGEFFRGRIDADDGDAQLRVEGEQRPIVASDIENEIARLKRISLDQMTHLFLEVLDHGAV